jgi:hypothetical protein
MDDDSVLDGAGPPEPPSLEEELVQQFGPEVLRNSPRTPPGTPPEDDDEDPDRYEEEDFEEPDPQYDPEYESFHGVVDLSKRRRSESEDEGTSNPLRKILRQHQKVNFTSLMKKLKAPKFRSSK